MDNLLTTVGYATTNDAAMNECYNEQSLSKNQDATTNTDATTNEEEYYQPKQPLRPYDISGLPTLITASAIIFVIVCKVHLSV